MCGPRGIGVHTQAKKLQEIYGWKVVDYQLLVKERLEKIIKDEVHLPNNVREGLSEIGLSQHEIDEIKSGKPFPAWKFIPWILDHLGYPLMKRPPPPPPEEGEAPAEEEELTPEQIAKIEKEKKLKEKEEQKRLKEEEEAKKAKEERRKRREDAIAAGEDLEALGLAEESPEEEEKVDDLSIDELVLEVDEETGKAPFIGGFILLGFPMTQEHSEKLKEHGISFDRVLYLNSEPAGEEGEAGKEVKERMSAIDMHYDWEAAFEQSQKILGVVKEHIGEEITRELPATGTIDEVTIRIQMEIDPFFMRADNPEDVRVAADLGEEEKLPKGDFGDYCPVTFINDGFLIKGKPDFEATVFGKQYLFASEKDLNEFKINPAKYLVGHGGPSSLPLEPPAPKIMILGTKGSGVTTQINKLCEKYKLNPFKLKEELEKKLLAEKDKRRR